MKPHRRRARVFTLYLPLAAILAVVFFPFLWMFLTSVKPDVELYDRVVRYWPSRFHWDNYPQLFASGMFTHAMRNSLIVSAVTCSLSIVLSSLAAYAVSRLKIRGRHLLLVGFLLVHMFPTVLFLIPLFAIFRSLGILNTLVALVLAYTTFTVPFSVWMLSGFFNAIPVELEESAMVDGCSRMGSFFHILLPLAAPGLAATAIYIFIYAWNEFLFATMFTGEATRTLPVALHMFVGQYTVRWGLLTAGGVVTVLPVIVLFMLIQRYLIQGLTAGAVKG